MNDRMVKFYMDFALSCAQMSRATRAQVGAAVVKDNNIISFSWNGTPAGWDNECEEREYMPVMEGDSDQWPFDPETEYPHEEEYQQDDGTFTGKLSNGLPDPNTWIVTGKKKAVRRYRLKTKPEVLHAERNALDKLARTTESGVGAVMFVTHSPCLECAKSIYGAGITQVYYLNEYRDHQGLKFLRECGIDLHHCATHTK